MRLSINLATRRRPDLLKRTLDTTLANIALPSTTLMVSIDDDDQPSISAAMPYIDRIGVSVKPREDTLGEKYNRVLTVAPADLYLAMVDYAPIITKDFDVKLIEAAQTYKDGYACVVGPFANLSFACIYAVTAKFAEGMEGIFPPYFPYWFIDHWLDDVAQMTGRMVFTNVVSDFWSKRPGTMERREPGWWGTFYDKTYHLRAAHARRIIDAMDETPDRKKGLIANFPRIQQRSAMINEQLRQNNDAWSDPSRDERYERIKHSAMRVLKEVTAKAA